jgi:hypothetical protein
MNMRWFYWYAYSPKTGAKIGEYGAKQMSDLDAWNFQTGIRAQTSPNVVLHRFTWTQAGGWVRDTRDDRALFSIPDVPATANRAATQASYAAAAEKFQRMHKG